MYKELEIWRFAVERLKQNEALMLLIVAESSGSSPGRQGFKMIVAENDLTGSIGGGVMEVKLVEIATEKLKTVGNELLIKQQIHRKTAQNPSGMICSGKQTVIFYKINSPHLKTVRKIVRAIKNHQPAVLQISNSVFQVAENEQFDVDFKFQQKGEKKFLYAERIGYKNKLFIIGGGHCALALSELMSKMDFHISLFDDRPSLNTLAKNEFADRKQIIESYENIADFVDSGANNFVVVMTLGYKSDEVVIRKLLDKEFKYFGVLGSKAKMKTLLRNLEKEGFEAEKMNRIHTPIGLPINSRTPEEIAVSIAAEIIAVKNSR